MMYQLHRIAVENDFLPTSYFYGGTDEISGTFSTKIFIYFSLSLHELLRICLSMLLEN